MKCAYCFENNSIKCIICNCFVCLNNTCIFKWTSIPNNDNLKKILNNLKNETCNICSLKYINNVLLFKRYCVMDFETINKIEDDSVEFPKLDITDDISKLRAEIRCIRTLQSRIEKNEL